MNRRVGDRDLTVWVAREMPPWTFGSVANCSSDLAVGPSWALREGDNGSTRAPVSSAEAISGDVLSSACTPGRRSANNAALCLRKVLIRGDVLMSVSNVGGVSVIVS